MYLFYFLPYSLKIYIYLTFFINLNKSKSFIYNKKMIKKFVYFIYVVPKYKKKHTIYIEYAKKKENNNEIIFTQEYSDFQQQRLLIKNLNSISLELNKIVDIKFKFKFKTKRHNFDSKEFIIPEKHMHYFFIIYHLKLQDYFQKIFLRVFYSLLKNNIFYFLTTTK